MVTSFKRVHVPRFCECCGKEEFEGTVFGKDAVRHLRVRLPDMRMVCDNCLPPPPPPSFEFWDRLLGGPSQ